MALHGHTNPYIHDYHNTLNKNGDEKIGPTALPVSQPTKQQQQQSNSTLDQQQQNDNNMKAARSRQPKTSTVAGARQWFDLHPIETTMSYQRNNSTAPASRTIIQITSPGEPQVQARLRFAQRGFFDPQKEFKKEFRLRIKSDLESHGTTQFPIFDPTTNLRITVTFHVCRMTKDIDNLLKLILDVLNGVIYHNDAAVTMIVAQKLRVESSNQSNHAFTDLTIAEHRIN